MKEPSGCLIPGGLAFFAAGILIAVMTDWSRPDQRTYGVLRYVAAFACIGAGAWTLRRWRDG